VVKEPAMSKRNDGGPAFPWPTVVDADTNTVDTGCEGMMLRDYFAAHAPPVPEWWPDAPWVGTKVTDLPAELEAARRTHSNDHTPAGFRDAAFEGAFDELDWWAPDLAAAADRHRAELAAARNVAAAANQKARLDRLACWALAWADAMLVARTKEPKS
jgi:hypothetical protein